MDLVLSSKKFGPMAIKRINYCQLYLNVTLMSDITTPNGRHLDKAAYEGNFTCLQSTNPGHRVNQNKPNEKAWREWKKFLHGLVYHDTNLTLKEALEEWTVVPLAYSRSWKHLYSPKHGLLLVRTAVGFLVHTRMQYDFDINPTDFRTTLPPDAVPIEAQQTQHTWIVPR